MSNRRLGLRRYRWVVLIGAFALVASSCGSSSDSDDGTSTATDATDAPAETSPPASTAAPTTAAPTTAAPATTAEPTTTVAPTTTAAPGPWEPYQDDENDCKRNRDYADAPVCMPPDIDTVSITRNSPLTIVTLFRAIPAPSGWQLTIGFDLDNDPSTGINEGIWSEFHGIGPDLEVDYFPDVGGSPFAQIHDVAPGPVYTNLEGGPPDVGPLGVWTWLDDMTLQLVLSDTLVPDSASGFPIAGQTMTDDYHDAFPDEDQQPLAFPS